VRRKFGVRDRDREKKSEFEKKNRSLEEDDKVDGSQDAIKG